MIVNNRTPFPIASDWSKTLSQVCIMNYDTFFNLHNFDHNTSEAARLARFERQDTHFLLKSFTIRSFISLIFPINVGLVTLNLHFF
jgi:hypothetical protein